MAVAWEERLEQLERNFLAEVEQLKNDILGQLEIRDDKYYNIENEVNTSFAHPPAAAPSISTCASTTSLPSSESTNSTSSSIRSQLLSSLSSSSSSTTPPPAVPSSSTGKPEGKSRRVAPERQALALVVRVRAAYKFEAQEDDELPLTKGLELIAFMREDESWWWGQLPDGRVGIFPSNFVTVLEGDPQSLPIREDDDDDDEEMAGGAVVEAAAETCSSDLPKPPPPSGPKPLARVGSKQRLEKIKVAKAAGSSPPPTRGGLSSSGSYPGPSPPTSTGAPPSLSSSASSTPTATTAMTSPMGNAGAVPEAARRSSPPPPAAHLKPQSLVGASVDAPAASRQRPPAATAPEGRAPLAQEGAPPSPTRPAVPRASLKPTQRGEEARRDWHDKRKSIMMLQEQSRTTRLLAQWENAGVGITFAPPSRPN